MKEITLESLGAPRILLSNITYYIPLRRTAIARRKREKEIYNRVRFWLKALIRYLNLKDVILVDTTLYHKGKQIFSFGYAGSSRCVYRTKNTEKLLSFIKTLDDPEKEKNIQFINKISNYTLKDHYREDEFWKVLDYMYEKHKNNEQCMINIDDLEKLIWKSLATRAKVLKHVTLEELIQLLDSGITKEVILKALKIMEKKKDKNLTFDEALVLAKNEINILHLCEKNKAKTQN